MGEGRRLRIGIDAHAIGERRTGNERFVSNLIPALLEASEHDYVLYFTNEEAASAWPRHERAHVRMVRPANPLARIPFGLPLAARRDGLDVLLVQYTGPPVAGVPLVTIVHDVAFALFPRYYRRAERVWMRRTIPFTMRHATRIVTVSEFSRQEIARVYGIGPERIDVAYNGVAPLFLEPPSRRAPVDPPYFLTVGNLQPRKNLATLVRAYRRLVDERPDLPERLVIVGQEWYAAEALYEETSDLRASGRIAFTGYVDDEDLVALLHGATAFAYPSIYEGFGLPPVEAMAAGAPVLVSDIAVTREVVADAALRVPPVDERAWSEALARVATDPALRSSVVAAGAERARRFTVEDSARAVLASLERAARKR